MVIKGKACGGARRLSAHLLRTDTNERAELLELRDVAALDLGGALREIEAVASGTRCQRPFYHASINSGPGERLTPEQQATAIDRLEAELGLTGQPRAVVAHEKEGRAHVHVVWSRIDSARMTAIPDSHNYRRHELAARALERAFGHVRVQGAHVEREGVARPSRTPSHAEMQQAARTGLMPQDAKAQITAHWRATDSGKAFRAAVEAEGWKLARGDRRDLVLIDTHGEVHSLARRIEGVKAAAVRERMADIDPASLPTVEAARAAQEAEQQGDERPHDPPPPAPSPESALPPDPPDPPQEPEPLRE